MLSIIFAAQLDGVSEKAKKRMAEHHSINDWLELSDSFSRAARDKYGKKRVSTSLSIINAHSVEIATFFAKLS